MALKKIQDQQVEGPHQRPILYDLYYSKDGEKKPIVIFSHGFKGFKDWGPFPLVAEKFAEAGFCFLKFNFSFNGGTVEEPVDFPDLEAFGQNNYSRELDDLGKMIEEVSSGKVVPEEEADLGRIYLLGHSRGGGISIIKAAEDSDKVKKLATWSAVSDFQGRIPTQEIQKWREEGVVHIPNSRTGQQMSMYYQFYEDLQENRERLNIHRAIRNLSIPYLIIHGKEDETVPVNEAYLLKEWNPGALIKVLPDTGHTLGAGHPFKDQELPEPMQQAVDWSIEHFLSKG